jgi:hypothetical protein
MLNSARQTVEACVLVGGGVLWTNEAPLQDAISRGVILKMLFSDPRSAWLVDLLAPGGATVSEYARRIQINTTKALLLAQRGNVRWHQSPVNRWFVLCDRQHVATKPIDILHGTAPIVQSDTRTVAYYANVFDRIWQRAYDCHDVLSGGSVVSQEGISPLRVFLSYASEDLLTVRRLYERLRGHGVDPWLDERHILPGQDWHDRITQAIRDADVVIVCLSQSSLSKTGYVQREIATALDLAKERPPGSIYIIPARLDKCQVPNRLRFLQYVDLDSDSGYEKLMAALHFCRQHAQRAHD